MVKDKIKKILDDKIIRISESDGSIIDVRQEKKISSRVSLLLFFITGVLSIFSIWDMKLLALMILTGVGSVMTFIVFLYWSLVVEMEEQKK